MPSSKNDDPLIDLDVPDFADLDRELFEEMASWSLDCLTTVAALGFGTETIPKVRKIVGPGSPAVTIAQVEMQRNGAATMMLLAVLQYVLFAVNPAPAGAAGPEPTYGSAVVDGDIGRAVVRAPAEGGAPRLDHREAVERAGRDGFGGGC